ncbi:MAG: hypothetical protein R6U96_08145 [Promethearchaeia archaeon]
MSKELNEDHISRGKEKEQSSESKPELEILQEENEELRFTIKEQKRLIKELNGQINQKDGIHSPNAECGIKEREVSILNDLCDRKENEINILEEKLQKLIKVLKHEIQQCEKDKYASEPVKDELLTAKKLIIQLTEENEEYEQRLDNFLEYTGEFIDWIEENIEEKNTFQNQPDPTDTSAFQKDILLEKIQKFRKKIRVAQSVLGDKDKQDAMQKKAEKDVISMNEDYRVIKYQLNNAYETIANMTRKIEKLENENKILQEKEQESSQTIEQLQDKLKPNKEKGNLQKDVKEDFNKDKERYQNILVKVLKNTPNPVNLDLFELLFQVNYRLLADRKKEIVLKVINDVLHQTSNREIIRVILRCLRNVKDPHHPIQLKRLANHQDWIIRLSLANSLTDFYTNNLIGKGKLQKILKILSKDRDPDVREAVIRTIKSLKNQ